MAKARQEQYGNTSISMLKGAGVDMTSPEPVAQALELFGQLLDEMEALVD